MQSIAVVVCGDLDRSPRMLNHAFEASRSMRTTLIGYQGSSLPTFIKERDIDVQYLGTTVIDHLRKLPRFLYLLYAVLRIVIQVSQLLWQLLGKRRFDFILIQNPPCVPLLFVAILVRLFTCGRTRLIIDWHNYGFSILRVNGSHRMLVKLARLYEV